MADRPLRGPLGRNSEAMDPLECIKAEANSRDVPYQSLIRIWLKEKLSA